MVGYYKVGSGKPSMTWSQSVDQAFVSAGSMVFGNRSTKKVTRSVLHNANQQVYGAPSTFKKLRT